MFLNARIKNVDLPVKIAIVFVLFMSNFLIVCFDMVLRMLTFICHLSKVIIIFISLT